MRISHEMLVWRIPLADGVAVCEQTREAGRWRTVVLMRRGDDPSDFGGQTLLDRSGKISKRTFERLIADVEAAKGDSQRESAI